MLQKEKHLLAFLKKVDIFSGLPNSFFVEFSKFLVEGRAVAEESVIVRGDKGKYVYFIKSGEIEVRHFHEMKGKGVAAGSNYYVSSNKQFHI